MSEGRWLRTVGAPTPSDPRDGELHQGFGVKLDQRFTLEPWDGRPDDEDVVYDLASLDPVTDDQGRAAWTYNYVGLARDIYGEHLDDPDDE